MKTLTELKEQWPNLYNRLIECDFRALYNDNVIWDAPFSETMEFPENIDKSKVVYEFKLNNKVVFFLAEENKDIDKIPNLFKNGFDNIYKNFKLFNQAMNIANSLPSFQLDESLFDDNIKKSIRKYGMNFKKLYEAYLLEAESEEDSPLGTEGAKEDEKDNERAEIKFTIWESPDKKVKWLNKNDKYQKIEYKFEDKEKHIKIDFLLGFHENSWKLWMGKWGSTSYDDEPYFDFKTEDFAVGITSALDKVQEILDQVREEPDDWVQFYVNR